MTQVSTKDRQERAKNGNLLMGMGILRLILLGRRSKKS